MDTQDIRFECLKLAAARDEAPAQITEAAREFYKFLVNAQPEQAPD